MNQSCLEIFTFSEDGTRKRSSGVKPVTTDNLHHSQPGYIHRAFLNDSQKDTGRLYTIPEPFPIHRREFPWGEH